jgi:hypothetical protein
VVGVAGSEPSVDVCDLVLELVDERDRRGDVSAPGLGDLEPCEQPAPLGPEEIGDRAGAAELDQDRVDPALERRLVADQVHAKASELAYLPRLRIRKPDRRHQVALREGREDERVGLVGLAGQGSEPLGSLGVGDIDIPAAGLERVVDEPGAGHRLDDGADGLSVDLVDATGQGSQRVDVRCDGELVEVVALVGEQADVLSSFD